MKLARYAEEVSVGCGEIDRACARDGQVVITIQFTDEAGGQSRLTMLSVALANELAILLRRRVEDGMRVEAARFNPPPVKRGSPNDV